MEKEEIIKQLTDTFLEKGARERSCFELMSTKKRHRFIPRISNREGVFKENLLSKTDDDEMRSGTYIKKNALCYVISGFGDYDDLIMSFEDAFQSSYKGASGTIIYDFKKNIMYLEEEFESGTSRRFIAKSRKL